MRKAKAMLAAVGLLTLAAGPALAETVQIRMKGMAFAPAEVKAHIGDTVEFINDDAFVHTATARSNEWDIQLPKGATQQLTLTRNGTIPYYCRLHPNMKGTITVSMP